MFPIRHRKMCRMVLAGEWDGPKHGAKSAGMHEASKSSSCRSLRRSEDDDDDDVDDEDDVKRSDSSRMALCWHTDELSTDICRNSTNHFGRLKIC